MSDVLALAGVSVVRDGAVILDDVTWEVEEGQRWVVLGPNGAGKTTLLQLAAARIHPTTGVVGVLGEVLGAVDVFELRPRIGLSSAALADRIPARETWDLDPNAAYVNILTYGVSLGLLASGALAWWLMKPVDSLFRRGGLSLVAALGGASLGMFGTFIADAVAGSTGLIALGVPALVVAALLIRRARRAHEVAPHFGDGADTAGDDGRIQDEGGELPARHRTFCNLPRAQPQHEDDRAHHGGDDEGRHCGADLHPTDRGLEADFSRTAEAADLSLFLGVGLHGRHGVEDLPCQR